MNQKKAELGRQVLALAATVNEGLEHIRHRFGEGHNPFDTVGLFADIVHAFAEIEAALRGPLGMLSEPSDLTGKTDVLRKRLSWMASSYEGNSSLSPHHTDPTRQIGVQVVRASVSQSIWRTLSQNQFVSERSDIQDILSALCDAIQMKSAHYPADVKAGMILALDATRVPHFALNDVVEQVRARLGSCIEDYGFRSVWLVGPDPRSTWRLDI